MKMRTAAEKAIRLDPLLAEARRAGDSLRATPNGMTRKKVFVARSNHPNHSISYAYYALYFFLPLGRIEEQSMSCGSPRKPTRSGAGSPVWPAC